MTFGGGTGGKLVQVYCGVEEQSVSWRTGQKKKILKRGGGARGVLRITKQHFNLNDGRSSDES